MIGYWDKDARKGKGRMRGKALSHDHKPEDPIEKARIEADGGEVRHGRINSKINLSRCLGDF
jgi:protein phosphatase 2C family protein 2/3